MTRGGDGLFEGEEAVDSVATRIREKEKKRHLRRTIALRSFFDFMAQ